MQSKRQFDGELSIDNRSSGGGLVEFATMTCSHCNVVFLRNPGRTRARQFCSKCDHYICDSCDERNCLPLRKLFDQLQEAAFRRETGLAPLIVNGIAINETNWHMAHDWKGKR
jgi:hypothetical protein